MVAIVYEEHIMPTNKKRSPLELKRLKMLIDVVYAVVVWRLFLVLPSPEGNGEKWDSVTSMILDEWAAFIVPALAMLIVIVYWVQNNELFGYLEHTDSIHTGISLFQVFSILLFLYSIRVGLSYEGATDARVFESVTAFLVGFFSYLGWWYAINNGLLKNDISQEKAMQIRKSNFAEPATALVTMPFAFVSAFLWELSWFLYPIIRKVFHSKKVNSNNP